MAGEDVKGVVVSEEAAVGLAHYLAEIGRLGKRTAREVGAAIQSSCNAQWGMAAVKQFNDSDGIGWVVDLSDKFNGEVLYAIVRSEKGERNVTGVIDEDKLRDMFPNTPPKKPKPESDQSHLNEMPSMEQQGLDPENPAGPTLAQQRDHLKTVAQNAKAENERLTEELAAARKVDPEGPALVRWKTAVSDGDGQGFEKEEKATTVAEVGELVQGLIAGGVKPDHIEVWTRRKQPKLRVDWE